VLVKDLPPINFKVEKEKFLKQIRDEVKGYDLQGI